MVRRVAKLFKPYKTQVGIVGLTILLTSGIGVANPILSKYVIDSALFPRVHLNLLYTLVGLMVGIAIVQTLIGVGQTYLTTVVGQRVMQDLRTSCTSTSSRCRCGSSPRRAPARSSRGSRTTSAACRTSSPTPRRRSSRTSSSSRA